MEEDLYEYKVEIEEEKNTNLNDHVGGSASQRMIKSKKSAKFDLSATQIRYATDTDSRPSTASGNYGNVEEGTDNVGSSQQPRNNSRAARFNLSAVAVHYHSDTDSRASTSSASEDYEYVETISRITEKDIALQDNGRPSLRRFVSKKFSCVRELSSKFNSLLSFSGRMIPSSAAAPASLQRSETAARRTLKGLKFLFRATCNDNWNAVSANFDRLAVDGMLPRSLFGECIGMKESKELGEHIFDGLARRRCMYADRITKNNLKGFWEQICDRSLDARLRTFFDMIDKNADGFITQDEIQEVLELSASANKLSRVKEKAKEYAAFIMEELDTRKLGHIEIENLKMLLLEGLGPSGKYSSATDGLSRTLSQKQSKGMKQWCDNTKSFVEDNWRRMWILLLWLSILAGLFTWKFIQYKRRAVFHVMGYCVCVAKGAAETLKFNMALILLPVCRNTITWLRNKTYLGVAVPFDDNLNFHKVIAATVVVGVGIHATSHLTCDFPRLLHATDEAYIPMRPFFGDQRPPNYWWFLKGVEGVTGLVMVILMTVAFTFAMPHLRRNTNQKHWKKLTGFNAFWFSHHLFVLVYALLILHGTFLYLNHKWYKNTTWMYLAIPMLVYAVEKTIRSLRSDFSSTKVLKAEVYQGGSGSADVVALRVSKPRGFSYKSGQYMFVNCPAISTFEWHPFSLTSAPGDDYLSVHIRAVGDWTRHLRDLFLDASIAKREAQRTLTTYYLGREESSWYPKIMIDGPYGAPAQDYKQYDVVLLVGLGIGATPFISIVKDIMNNMRLRRRQSYVGMQGAYSANSFNVTKVYFYWVTREEGSFDWFRDVMNDVSMIDRDGVIELHNHCTSIYEEGDARSALIAMLQDLRMERNGEDIVSGINVKTHFAKPKWLDVFKRLARNHRGAKIGVFYCGLPAAGRELKQLSSFLTSRSDTTFEFHKENF